MSPTHAKHSGHSSHAAMTAQAHDRLMFVVKILAAVILILLAIQLEPYIVVRNESAAVGTSADMAQKTFDLDAAHAPVPTVAIILHQDTTDGWDLQINTTNFSFTPQNINKSPVADQGHAHLYIDGALTVVFGPWYHIDHALLPPGKHTLMVTLNANDHSVFTHDQKPIEATRTVFISPL